jgi:hypothetical protein
MSDKREEQLQRSLDNLKSKDVEVLKDALFALGRLKDVRAVEPLLELLDDDERMSLLYDPEDWDNHIVVATIEDMGLSTLPYLIKRLEHDGTLVHVIASIKDQRAVEALLNTARKSLLDMRRVYYAFCRSYKDIHRRIDQNDLLAQTMINGFTDMVCDESIEFWEETASNLFYDLTQQQFAYLLLKIPETRKARLLALYDEFENMLANIESRFSRKD